MKKFVCLLILPALVATLMVIAPDTAKAQQRLCIARSHMIDALIDKYGEQLAEVHEIKGAGLLEFNVSPTEGTWTALITDDENFSCVLATGEGVDPEKSLHLETGFRIRCVAQVAADVTSSPARKGRAVRRGAVRRERRSAGRWTVRRVHRP